jgi:hypothetical protein
MSWECKGATNMTASKSAIENRTLLQQIDNASLDVLERIAEDPVTPADILRILASWDNPHVRAAVIDNPLCPFDLLLMLREDESPDVRYRLAECPHVPIEILELLKSEDDNCYVAFRAARTIDRIRRANVGTAEIKVLMIEIQDGSAGLNQKMA